MPSNKKRNLNERAYRANVLPDGLVARIEGLEGTNLMPENTDIEQLKGLTGLVSPQKDKGSRPFSKRKGTGD